MMPTRPTNPIHLFANMLQGMGNRGDSLLVHVNPREMQMLKANGGSGTVNQHTGLLQFDPGDAGDAGDGSGGPDSGGPGDPGDPGDQGSGPSAPGGKMAGEIGTGHGLGASVGGEGFGGGMPDPGLPEGATAFTGINMLDRALNNVAAHPAATAINAAVGMIPGVGMLNTAAGLANLMGAGLPTAGGMITGAFSGASPFSGASGPAQNSQSDSIGGGNDAPGGILGAPGPSAPSAPSQNSAQIAAQQAQQPSLFQPGFYRPVGNPIHPLLQFGEFPFR